MALPDRIQAAQPSDLGGSFGCAFVPFLPFDIEPFRASEDGSNASNDSDGDGACRNSDGTDQNPFGVTK